MNNLVFSRKRQNFRILGRTGRIVKSNGHLFLMQPIFVQSVKYYVMDIIDMMNGHYRFDNVIKGNVKGEAA